MAPFPNPTFGCGKFLPGFGPFSIPKYDGPKNPVGVPGGDGVGPPPPEDRDHSQVLLSVIQIFSIHLEFSLRKLWDPEK